MLLFAITALANPDATTATISIGDDVAVRHRVEGSVFALGGTLVIDAPVEGNVYGLAEKVHITRRGSVSGTVNLASESMRIEGSIGGLKGAVASLDLDAPVQGAMEIAVDEVTIGRRARVTGSLDYTSRERITALEKVSEGTVEHHRSEDDVNGGFHLELDL